jgi:hypothetical protein
VVAGGPGPRGGRDVRRTIPIAYGKLNFLCDPTAGDVRAHEVKMTRCGVVS